MAPTARMLVLVVLAILAPALSIARFTVEGMASPRHASARSPKHSEAGHRQIEALGRKRQIDEAWRVFNSIPPGEADVRAHASMLDALARVGHAEVRSRPTTCVEPWHSVELGCCACF